MRIFNVYGPGLSSFFLIPTIISQLKTRKIILQDPAPKRDYIYISDVVMAFLKAMDLPVSGLEVFNLGYDASYRVSEVVNLIMKISGIKCDVVYSIEHRKNEIPDTIADIMKARKLLNWAPKVSLEDGLRETLLAGDYTS